MADDRAKSWDVLCSYRRYVTGRIDDYRQRVKDGFYVVGEDNVPRFGWRIPIQEVMLTDTPVVFSTHRQPESKDPGEAAGTEYEVSVTLSENCVVIVRFSDRDLRETSYIQILNNVELNLRKWIVSGFSPEFQKAKLVQCGLGASGWE